MTDSHTFRTKTGYCEVTPDTIRLVRTGLRGWLAHLLHGDRFPSELPRDQITRVEPHAPITGATRGYFRVHYRAGRELKKRIVILPGVFAGGGEEFEKAKRLFESEGMLEGTANNRTDSKSQ